MILALLIEYKMLLININISIIQIHPLIKNQRVRKELILLLISFRIRNLMGFLKIKPIP